MTKVSTVTAVSRHSLFGPPPFLEEEDAAAYDEIYGRVCAAVKPVDIIDEILTADIASLQVEVSGWRRCKSSRIRERGLAALEQFLCKELEYQHYQNRFADDLTEILRSHVPKHNADEAARLLARACAQNQGPAVDEVNKVLDRIGHSMDYLLQRAQRDEAQELTQKYRGREPATVEFIDKLLAAAGRNFHSLTAQALAQELDCIERIDRLITNAENRRDASLREIDRRRAVLEQKLRKSPKEVGDNQLQVIEAALALQPKEKPKLDE